ncbi:MAG: ABC transporter substrate-binding protein, partial [Gemmatimonadales bacterium]
REIQAAATALGLQLQLLEARSADDLDRAVAAMVKARRAGLVVLVDNLFVTERDRLAQLAQKARLPSVFASRENVEAGGLLSYGPSPQEQWRRAAYFIDKILKGAKPADLPVEQPTRFELVLNLKTAKALGITFPPSILLRATEAIE